MGLAVPVAASGPHRRGQGVDRGLQPFLLLHESKSLLHAHRDSRSFCVWEAHGFQHS